MGYASMAIISRYMNYFMFTQLYEKPICICFSLFISIISFCDVCVIL